jgi:hypothetical protein
MSRENSREESGYVVRRDKGLLHTNLTLLQDGERVSFAKGVSLYRV